MKNPFGSRAPSFDADAINATIQRALSSAGIDTRSGTMRTVSETIEQALGTTQHRAAPSSAARTAADDLIVDVTARFVDGDADVDAAAESPGADGKASTGKAHPPGSADGRASGSFTTHTFANAAGRRTYKLYVPAGHSDRPRPLLVMLHGCTQSADDFAAGTRMNRLADQHGLLVAYPEQPIDANPSKCWGWFNTGDQQRDSGEPALLAGIVREIASRHDVDRQRIFVAGLSAGAAMAVILGETYPDLFAAVGAHSGLPYASASDLPSAMAAMKAGRGASARAGRMPGASPQKGAVRAVPTIVFHGDRDHTVRQENGARIVQQAEAARRTTDAGATLRTTTETGEAAGGRRFTRTVHADESGRPLIEHWCVHGAGHAWSGGSASGSFTDHSGPDASARMLQFFLATQDGGGSPDRH